MNTPQYTFTLINNPEPIAKCYRLSADGQQIEKDVETSAQRLTACYDAQAERVTETLEGIAQRFDALTTRQASVYGVPKNGMAKCRLVSKGVAAREGVPAEGSANVVLRTRDCFEYPSGPALFMLDHDVKGADAVLHIPVGSHSKCGQPCSDGDLLALLSDVVPELMQAPAIVRPSGSTWIRRTSDEKQLRGAGGVRVLMGVSDGRAIPVLAAALYVRLGEMGLLHVEVSKCGSLLARGPFDFCVYQPERFDFIGGAEVGEGLDRNPPPSRVLNGYEAPLDVCALLAKHKQDCGYGTASWENYYKAGTDLLRDARRAFLDKVRRDPELQAKAKARRSVWVAKRVAESIAQYEKKHSRIPTERERQDIAREVEGFAQTLDGCQELPGWFVIPGLSVTVADVLTNSEKYFGCEIPDPLEPDYDGGRPCAIVMRGEDGVPVIISQAHGTHCIRLRSAVSMFEPEPLRRPLAAPTPYPIHALGTVLGDAAKRLHEVIQAPAALCGQAVLAAASLAVQQHADVSISGNTEPLSLWHVTIGESGERKSAVDSWALKAHYMCERDEKRKWDEENAAFQSEAKAFDAAVRAAEKKAKGDVRIFRAALSELGQPPDAPLQPWLMLGEPTMEGLHKFYQAGRPSIGLFNDDAGDFLGGHAMSRDNRAKSAAGFSKLWDTGQFSRVRAGDGAGKYYGRRLAMHLMVQPIIAEQVLGDDVLVGQGFLPRCLLAWPESNIGKRVYQDVDLSQDAAMGRYWQRMADLLHEPPMLQEGTRNELSPRVLSLTSDAMLLWIEIKNAFEQAIGANGAYCGIRAWASKAGSQVARVAGVLTLAENGCAKIIDKDAIERAAKIVTYHLDEAARIVGTASVPAPVRNAEALLEWCHKQEHELLHSRKALHSGPNVIRTQGTFTEAVMLLERHGWARRIEGGMVVDGKHLKRVWRVAPKGSAL